MSIPTLFPKTRKNPRCFVQLTLQASTLLHRHSCLAYTQQVNRIRARPPH